jgi:hypothetical protein
MSKKKRPAESPPKTKRHGPNFGKRGGPGGNPGHKLSPKEVAAFNAARTAQHLKPMTPEQIAAMHANNRGPHTSLLDTRNAVITRFLGGLDEIDAKTGKPYRILLMEMILRSDTLAAKFLDKLLPSLGPDVTANIQQNLFGGAPGTPGATSPQNLLEMLVLNRAQRVQAQPIVEIDEPVSAPPPVNGNGNGEPHD